MDIDDKIYEEDLNYMLGGETPIEGVTENLPAEDLLMIQPDGTRACVGWELAGKGYHVDNKHYDEVPVGLTGKDLLKDAYARAGIKYPAN